MEYIKKGNSMNMLWNNILNSEDLIEENIALCKLLKEMSEAFKQVLIKNQERVLELYLKFKSEEIKETLKKQMIEAYKTLLLLEEQIEDLNKMIKDLNKLKNKIL